jgi:formate dehydrogenase iron-sulfur subunit
VHNGLEPACAKACPTGAIQFGDRDDMLAAADERLAAIREDFPSATVLDRRDVRLLILLADPASQYKLTAEAV